MKRFLKLKIVRNILIAFLYGNNTSTDVHIGVDSNMRVSYSLPEEVKISDFTSILICL
jgi:hypothetical protein